MILALALSLAPLCSPGPQLPSDTSRDPVQPLSVLYAGSLSTARAKAFAQWLSQRFSRVETLELAELTQAKAHGFDVVVADWKRRYVKGADGNVEFDAHVQQHYELPADFSKPVVMIGPVAGEIAPESKIGWL